MKSNLTPRYATPTEKRKLFYENYDDPWDYIHGNLDRGDMYHYFLKKTGREPVKRKEDFPIHLKDIPESIREEYLLYLKEKLAEYYDIPFENVDKEWNLESAIEAFWSNYGPFL